VFLAAIFFLPWLTPEVDAQVTSGSGIIDDDEGAPGAQVTSESGAVDDDELTPSGYPSRLLGRRLPSSVDLRSEMPPVADQGDFASMSCVIFATAYYQMTQYVKHFKHPKWDLKNPEHQFSVAFVQGQGGQGLAYNVYKVLKQYGCVDTAEMQYSQWTAVHATANQLEAAKPYRISSCTPLWDRYSAGDLQPYNPPNPIRTAKAWLAARHVLSVSIDPNSPGFPGYSGNCTPPTRFFDTIDPKYQYSAFGGHGVAICGYNDNINPRGKGPDHRGGFLMVNSEGPHWNGKMQGYIWLSYAYVKQYIPDCWIMMMDGESDAPVITGYTIEDMDRDGISVTINGTNLGSYRRLAAVTFNGVRAYRVLSWTNESVTVFAPTGITSGPLVVYNWENTPSNSLPFVND
jgi:hypothetical protein